jgi:hypothetical protein
VAALHEHVVLLRMAQGTALHTHAQYSDDRVIPCLKALCDEALSFRLHYRLAQVSLISLHDMVYGTIAAALGLDALSDKIARDLTAVEQRLRQHASERALAVAQERAELERKREAYEREAETARVKRERQSERRSAWFTGIVTAALAFIACITAVERVKDIKLRVFGLGFGWILHVVGLGPEIKGISGARDELISAAGLLIAAVLAVFGFVYAWRRARSGDPTFGHLIQHAAADLRAEGGE